MASARSFHKFVLVAVWIGKTHAWPSIETSSKEGDCGTVHSPMSIPRPHEQKTQNKSKPRTKKRTKTKQTQTRKQTPPNKKGIRPWRKDYLPLRIGWWHLVCHALHRPSKQTKQPKPKSNADGHQRWIKATNHSAETQDPASQDPPKTNRCFSVANKRNWQSCYSHPKFKVRTKLNIADTKWVGGERRGCLAERLDDDTVRRIRRINRATREKCVRSIQMAMSPLVCVCSWRVATVRHFM